MSWDRIANTTIARHLRTVEDDTVRRRLLLRRMESLGNILYDMGGDTFDWRVRWRDHDMEVNNGEQAVTFDRTDLWKKASLDWGGYIVKDSYTLREKHQNKGTEAIVKWVGKTSSEMMKSIRQKFPAEFFVDQSATGNSDRLVGLESMFAQTQTVKISDGSYEAYSAADVVGAPNDTYAGLSTKLGNYDGTWNTQSGVDSTWPFGNGDAAYDFWSPVIVNYVSTEWAGATNTWAANAIKSTRFAIDAVNHRCEAGMGADLVLLSSGMYRQWKNQFDQYQKVEVINNKDDNWGFGETMTFDDGVRVTADFDVTPGVGYVLSMSNMEYHSVFPDQLFLAEGPDYSIEARAWRFLISALGQIKFASPKHFAKLAQLS